jgi:hypothetical protein
VHSAVRQRQAFMPGDQLRYMPRCVGWPSSRSAFAAVFKSIIPPLSNFQNNRNIACVNRFCREGTAFPIMLCPPGYGGQSHLPKSLRIPLQGIMPPLWPEKKLINVAFSEGCFLNVVFLNSCSRTQSTKDPSTGVPQNLL